MGLNGLYADIMYGAGGSPNSYNETKRNKYELKNNSKLMTNSLILAAVMRKLQLQSWVGVIKKWILQRENSKSVPCSEADGTADTMARKKATWFWQ